MRTRLDLTERMMSWAKKRVKELEGEDLCGFIFKGGSPSSGMERVKVYNDRGMAEKKGVGMFARVFMDHFPLVPVEEEGRLHDPKLRENFIESIFALMRWRELLQGKKSLGALVAFSHGAQAADPLSQRETLPRLGKARGGREEDSL